MGGKNKHKKGGGSHKNQNNSSSTNYAPKLTEQQMCDLVTEATEMHVLLNERHQKMKQAKNFVYILSTRWLKQWKEYVGYDSLFGDEKQGSKKTGKRRPGPPNQDLITTSRIYLQIPEQIGQQYTYLNQIFKDKIQKGDDYIPVTQQIWRQFNTIYGPGTEIKRPFRITKYKNVFVDSDLFKFDCIFMNLNDEEIVKKIQSGKVGKNQMDKVLPDYKVQVSAIWEIQNLYNFFQKLSLVLYNSQKVTLWLCHNFMATQAIKQQLIKSGKSQKYQLYGRKLQIEDYQDKDIDDFLKQQYTIIAEIGDSRITPLDVNDDMFGYCQECVEKKSLNHRCLCAMKFYCSQSCRTEDQDFHFKTCSLAFSNQDDEQYNKKKIIGDKVCEQSKCGLKNLGNTCYMNSVLQGFLCLGFLTDFFVSNQYTKHVSGKEDNAAIFLDSVSRFCKKMSEQKAMGSIQPWDIKGKVNHFLVPFKGYKQHDALDFLMGFLNTINDCLEKVDQQAYQQIIKSNIVGFYDSLIICPACQNQATNTQPYIQLTLPIKQKAKKSLFNYVIFDNPLSLVNGKAEVKDTWSQVRSDLGVDENCLIYAGGEGDTGLTEMDTLQDKSSEHNLKKCKKQVLFYPYLKIRQSQQVFSANFITTKNLGGNNLKANSGYPFPVVVDNKRTIGHFFIDLLRYLNLDKNKEQVIANLQKKYDEIKEQQKQEKNKKKIEQKEQKQQKANQNSNKKVNKDQKKEQKTEAQPQVKVSIQNKLLELNQLLNAIIDQISMQVFVQDTKRIRNICFFCKKRCQSCLLTPDFRTSAEDSLGMKGGQARFFISITPKLEQTKKKLDLASSGDTSVKECLALFSEPQTLDEENAWYCPTCEDMRLAFKQLHICQYPKYLILQLSRFKNGNNGKIKNNQPVFYNEYENFGTNKFRLSFVIIHEGSIQGGHYWAICRRGEQFYSFNDEKVSKTDKICNKNAYILCYQMIEQGKDHHHLKIQKKQQKQKMQKLHKQELKKIQQSTEQEAESATKDKKKYRRKNQDKQVEN